MGYYDRSDLVPLVSARRAATTSPGMKAVHAPNVERPSRSMPGAAPGAVESEFDPLARQRMIRISNSGRSHRAYGCSRSKVIVVNLRVFGVLAEF